MHWLSYLYNPKKELLGINKSEIRSNNKLGK